MLKDGKWSPSAFTSRQKQVVTAGILRKTSLLVLRFMEAVGMRFKGIHRAWQSEWDGGRGWGLLTEMEECFSWRGCIKFVLWDRIRRGWLLKYVMLSVWPRLATHSGEHPDVLGARPHPGSLSASIAEEIEHICQQAAQIWFSWSVQRTRKLCGTLCVKSSECKKKKKEKKSDTSQICWYRFRTMGCVIFRLYFIF